MKRETLSQAIGEIDTKYISEAMIYAKSSRNLNIYKNPLNKYLIAAVFCVFIIIGFGIFHTFSVKTVTAYAYRTNKELSSVGTILSTGKVNADGSMTGTPLSFYIQGNNITSIRYSVKNQWIDFVDWTEKRDEFGIAKNFTVPYGSDESEYYYLVVNWEPNELWQALNDKNFVIEDLPQDLREDTIVLEISFNNKKTETKAVKIELQDNGTFIASFDNYTITEQDKFVNRPDSNSIDRSILYAQGTDTELQNTEKETKHFQAALTVEELEAAKAVAFDYYKNTMWKIEEIRVTEDTNRLYENETIEAEYDIGNIIIFDVIAVQNNEIENRSISVARTDNNNWTVINEGF
jgi:hypothetical protein